MKLRAVIFLLFACVLRVAAQDFTYVDWDILKADSFPVRYEEVIPLETDYSGYDYEVRLDYPEYARLTAEEAKCVAAWGEALPATPRVVSHVGVARKKGMLDVSFVPIVRRDGKYYRLTSFKMNILRHPKAGKRALLAASHRLSAAERYASNSVLSLRLWRACARRGNRCRCGFR